MRKQIVRFLAEGHPGTQAFGVNPDRYAQFGLRGHDGVDYEMPVGTPVFAGINGKIQLTANDVRGYGLYVREWDPKQNLQMVFAHLSKILVTDGQEVTPDTVIGLSGNTGNSTGPHLHWGAGETDIAGQRINRGNGYDGWLNPLTLTEFVTATKGGEPTQAPATGYTGPTPPPYAPTHSGQTVSVGGNSFRSDDGSTWIFQGSDAERAAQQQAVINRELYASNALMTDPGVYLNKSNLTKRYADGQWHPSDDGMRDAWRLVIKGNWKARLDPGGPNNAPQRWFEKPGEYQINPPGGDASWLITTLEARPIPPPPEPPQLPDIQATTPPAAGAAGAGAPLQGGTGNLKPSISEFGPYTDKGQPGTKRVYNLIVGVANKILGQFAHTS